jgi:hypothetical protein
MVLLVTLATHIMTIATYTYQTWFYFFFSEGNETLYE